MPVSIVLSPIKAANNSVLLVGTGKLVHAIRTAVGCAVSQWLRVLWCLSLWLPDRYPVLCHRHCDEQCSQSVGKALVMPVSTESNCSCKSRYIAHSDSKAQLRCQNCNLLCSQPVAKSTVISKLPRLLSSVTSEKTCCGFAAHEISWCGAF